MGAMELDSPRTQSKRHPRQWTLRVILAVLALSLISGGAGSVATYELLKHNQITNAVTPVISASSTATASESVAATVSKSVVSITSTATSYNVFGFGRTQESSGTGIIVRSDGYI